MYVVNEFFCEFLMFKYLRLLLKVCLRGVCGDLVIFVYLRLPDGLTRRGDINVLLLGDPGTAKSQLLKFVENCSPIGVGV